MTMAQVGGKVISLTHRKLFTHRKYSWYSFLLEAVSTPGPQCDRKDYVNEKYQCHHLESNQRPCDLQYSILTIVGRIAQSLQRLTTGWTFRGSNPSGGEIFRTCPDRPWGPPIFLYNGYRVFPGSKEWSRRDADPSPPSSAVVKKEQSYMSTPPLGCTVCK